MMLEEESGAFQHANGLVNDDIALVKLNSSTAKLKLNRRHSDTNCSYHSPRIEEVLFKDRFSDVTSKTVQHLSDDFIFRWKSTGDNSENEKTLFDERKLPDIPAIIPLPSSSSEEDARLDPISLARKLFEETLENFDRSLVCSIIGKGYNFNFTAGTRTTQKF